MGKTGVINRDFTGEENNVYHDVIRLFKIYRAVNWRMQIKVNQVKHRIREEYGTDLDEFLDSIYQAGMDINQDLDDMKQRIEVINRSNKFLKLIDEAVELMRNFHPQGERYYWVLYYSYMSARKAENIDEILDLLEPHFPKITRIHRATYFRWREQAFQAVSSILWGWFHLVCAVMEHLGGIVTLSQLYEELKDHPKAVNNKHYKERIRATLYEHRNEFLTNHRGSYWLSYM